MNIIPYRALIDYANRKLAELRQRINLKPRYSIVEAAQKAGLEVCYSTDLPATHDGVLEPSDTPRYVLVKQDLPSYQQAWALARELGFLFHQGGSDSLLLNQPWKWEMLAAAPEHIRIRIAERDSAWRAHMIMLHFATGDDFRGYCRKHYRVLFWNLFADNIIGFHLYTLRVKTWLFRFGRKFAIA